MSFNVNGVDKVTPTFTQDNFLNTNKVSGHENLQQQLITEPKLREASPFVDLPQPCKSIVDIDMSAFVGVASPGADVLALLSELTDDQRRANRENMMAQTQVAVETIKDQAQMMRDQARTALIMSSVSCLIEFGAAVTSVVGNTKAIKSTANIGDAGLRASLLQAESSKVQGISQATGSLAKALSAVEEFLSAGSDAAIKDKEASLETIRAFRAQLESLDEALKEVLAKARNTHETIQQNMNQTRTRILG